MRIARRVVLALVPALAATLVAERTDWWRTSAAIGRGPAVPFPPLRNTIAPVLAGFRDPGRPAGH